MVPLLLERRQCRDHNLVPYLYYLSRQAGELQYELRCAVEVMMGFGAWDECGGGEKLLDLRAARLVVATADAFEHAMCKVGERNTIHLC